jgi:hypothetical protein
LCMCCVAFSECTLCKLRCKDDMRGNNNEDCSFNGC